MKFQNSKSSSFRKKNFTEKIPYALHKNERLKREKWKKKAKIKISILIFFYTAYLATLQEVTKNEDPCSNRS